MSKTSDQRKKDADKAVRVNEKKWSKTLMDAGWTAFPSIILEKQHALGLDPLDVNIILYLSTYWWESDNKPHPSKKTIAEAIGRHPRTVQRRIEALEKAGFIRREYRTDKNKGNTSNKYHFDGLIEASQQYAEEKLQDIEDRQKSVKDRKSRKRPKLRAV